MKGSLTLPGSKDLNKIFFDAINGKPFHLTINDQVVCRCVLSDVNVIIKSTRDEITANFFIGDSLGEESPLYAWLKEHYPNVLMEYTLIGQEENK